MALQQRVYQMRVCWETASAAKSPESETLGVELGVAVQVCHPSPWELRQDYRNGCEAILGDTVRRANNPKAPGTQGLHGYPHSLASSWLGCSRVIVLQTPSLPCNSSPDSPGRV